MASLVNAQCLNGTNWLSGDCINHFVEQWRSPDVWIVDPLQFDFLAGQDSQFRLPPIPPGTRSLYVPFNRHGLHWMFFRVEDLTQPTPLIEVYDSDPSTHTPRSPEDLTEARIRQYVEADPRLAQAVVTFPSCPRQDNGHDCGVYCLESMRRLIHNMDLPPLYHGPALRKHFHAIWNGPPPAQAAVEDEPASPHAPDRGHIADETNPDTRASTPPIGEDETNPDTRSSPPPIDEEAAGPDALSDDEETAFQMVAEDKSVEYESYRVREDRTTAIHHKFVMAQAAMHVVPLDPHWRKTVGGLQNRPPDPANVEQLVESFDYIRRHAWTDQLRISMSTADLQACCEYTVKHMTDLARLAGEPVGALYADKETLGWLVMKQPPKHYTHYTQMPVLCWPPDRRPYPQLDAGQHRRAALIKKFRLDEGRAGLEIINPTNMKQCGWGVSIADIDKIDADYHTAVKVNKKQVYNPASDGDNFANAYELWRA